MNRRAFLLSTSAIAGGALLAGCAGDEAPDGAAASEEPLGEDAAGRTLGPIGVQLYSVRGLMEEDVAGTLQQVAEIGYEEVEFAGYFDHAPAEIRSMLDANGLRAPAVHAGLDLLRNDLDGVLEAAQVIGHSYIVCPWLSEEERSSLDIYREHAAFFNEVGARCQEAGLQFAYHNHDFEFEAMDGTLPFDVLLEETDPNLVQIELDLFWIVEGGEDPMAYFQAYPGRFPLCHVKDRTAGGDMVSVGQGAIDFASIFAVSEQAGLQHYFVEHDNPDDPMASIRNSYNYLQQLHF